VQWKVYFTWGCQQNFCGVFCFFLWNLVKFGRASAHKNLLRDYGYSEYRYSESRTLHATVNKLQSVIFTFFCEICARIPHKRFAHNATGRVARFVNTVTGKDLLSFRVPKTLSYFRNNAMVEFYILLAVHLGSILVLVNNQLDVQFFFRIYLFQFSTCFEHPCANHQENQLY
jgi:hypothetical protein